MLSITIIIIAINNIKATNNNNNKTPMLPNVLLCKHLILLLAMYIYNIHKCI